MKTLGTLLTSITLLSFLSCKEECGNCVIVDDYGNIKKHLDCEIITLSECQFYKDNHTIDGQCSCSR